MSYKASKENFEKIILINWIPRGCETGTAMLHAGTLPAVERLVSRHPIVAHTCAYYFFNSTTFSYQRLGRSRQVIFNL
jgi:hypothetical protein